MTKKTKHCPKNEQIGTSKAMQLCRIKTPVKIWCSAERKSRQEEKVLARICMLHTFYAHSYIYSREPWPMCSSCNHSQSVDHIWYNAWTIGDIGKGWMIFVLKRSWHLTWNTFYEILIKYYLIYFSGSYKKLNSSKNCRQTPHRSMNWQPYNLAMALNGHIGWNAQHLRKEKSLS